MVISLSILEFITKYCVKYIEYSSIMQWLLLIQVSSTISQELALVNIDENPSTEVNDQSTRILVNPNTWNLLVLIMASFIVLGYNPR
jgi:hypothetical protein